MSRAGFLLAELSVTLLVLALAVVALVPVFAVNIRSGKASARSQQAAWLSQELLEEVRMRKWDENTPASPTYTVPSATLGVDVGESAADKRTFDDVDDFNGWTESPARDPVMGAIPDLPDYARSVTVQYVIPDVYVATTTLTDYKLVTACTQIPGRSPKCLDTIVSNR